MPSVALQFVEGKIAQSRCATDGKPAGRRRADWQNIRTKIECFAMRHFVYILKNERGRHYVGQTKDLNARLREHNIGSVSATKRGKPWHVEWFCCFRESKDAIVFERYLKSGSGVTFRQRHLVPNKLR